MPAPLAALAALLLGAGLALAPALLPDAVAPAVLGAAHAEPPLTNLDGEITDKANVLGTRRAEVQAALDKLANDTNLQLFVVYVDSFDGQDGTSWANNTANNTHLGNQAVLLAIATQERNLGLSFPNDANLSQGDQTRVFNAARDAARTAANAGSGANWAAPAVDAANTLRSVAGGGGSGGGSGPLVVGGVVVVAAVGGWLWTRRRRQAAGQPASTPRSELDALPTPELDKRASAALVEIDDALKTSDQELGFAQAEFGIEATQEFQSVLAKAKADVHQAFVLRQHLDDDVPDPEAQRREWLVEIITLVDGAGDALDAQTKSFDDLRKLAERAPQVLQETSQRADEITARIAVSRQSLATLQATYPATALTSVSANPDQAGALIEGARTSVAAGNAALEKKDNNTAVAQARAAQNALGQAVRLLDAVDHAGNDLAEAGPRLDKGIASITSDIADASRLAPIITAAGDSSVAPAVAEAQAAVAQAQQARQGGDPLAALARLTAAEAALDERLAPARAKSEADSRAAALLRDTLGRVDSQIRATDDFISTRRQAVGPDARTRLAEAVRLAQEARQLQPTDPQAALSRAQQALQLAAQAARMAETDVNGWGQGPGAGGGGPNIGGMVLGGILIDSILRGGGGMGGGRRGGGGFGGGFGGGMGGGGFGGGGRSGMGGRF